VQQEKGGGGADEGDGERETWRGGGGEGELSREGEGNGAAAGRRDRHMGGREEEGGRVLRRGGDKVGLTHGGTRNWGAGKGILRNKNQNKEGDVNSLMLPEESNQERTGRSPKKVSLDTPRKCEPTKSTPLKSEGSLSATLKKVSLDVPLKCEPTEEKEKEKDNGPPAKK
jgi:hypothetical protein